MVVAVNLYRVTPMESAPYTVTAPSIQHVVAFTKHWRSVVVRKVRVYACDYDVGAFANLMKATPFDHLPRVGTARIKWNPKRYQK